MIRARLIEGPPYIVIAEGKHFEFDKKLQAVDYAKERGWVVDEERKR